MNTILALIGIILFGVLVYYIRQYLRTVIDYKENKSLEIKRRLQLEGKNEKAYQEAIASELDDKKKIALELKAARERHQRAMTYVLQDVFERLQ